MERFSQSVRFSGDGSSFQRSSSQSQPWTKHLKGRREKEGEKGYKSVRIECTAIRTVMSKMFKHSCSPKKAKQSTRLRNLKTELLLSEASKYYEEEKATVTPFQNN